MSTCNLANKHEIMKSYGIGGCAYCKIDELEARLDAVRDALLGQDCEHKYGKQQKQCGACVFCSVQAAINGKGNG